MSPSRTAGALLLLLFTASGCASLIYEIVWLQRLGLSLGASSVSLAILLTSFMVGMCLGSSAFPRCVSPKWHPLAVYSVLELLIAACGLIIHGALPAVGKLYWSLAAHGSADLVARAGVALIVLLPPTALMGATLPAISRLFVSSATGMSPLGRFYAANTLGAVVGCLASGLYLLRLHDVAIATGVAV
ncbi:MAG: SAM-dependent methyltransferase, partial [Planctomycetaceae bacterium]